MRWISRKSRFTKIGLPLVIVFAVFGSMALLISNAATATFTREMENWTVDSPATVITDTNASNDGAVRMGTGSTGGGGGFPTSRSKYKWPLSRYSIWNTPIGSNAVYIDANINTPARGTRVDNEFLSLDPAAPVKTLITDDGNFQVKVLASLESNGAKNGCTALLSANDSNRIYQGQWLTLQKGGNPTWPYNYSIVKQANPLGDPVGQLVALNGPGMWGCHGGSALSGFAGAIKKGELSGTQPIRHALQYQLYCYLYCTRNGSNGKPFRWPAYRADGYWNDVGQQPSGYTHDGRPRWYNGPNPNLQMGALMALKPDFNVSSLQSAHARKMAQALKDYGAYLADDAAQDVAQWTVEYGAEFGDGGTFEADIATIVRNMHIVNNNSPTAVGGGGNPRTCYAPPFADGTVDGITTNPNGNVSEPAGC